MGENLKRLNTIEQLEKYLYEASNIVIYGIGEYGRCLMEYIENMQHAVTIDSIVVSDIKNSVKEYKGLEVQEADTVLNNKKEVNVIIAISSPYQEEICRIVSRYTQQYICITDRLHYRLKMKNPKKVFEPISKVDFCVVGFPKCGTTSFWDVLRDMEYIYLPKTKETYLMDWYKNVSQPEEFLVRKYFNNVKENQVVGMVEPGFYLYPLEVKQLLGDEIKIVFIVRNPTKALFSQFKMQTRTGSGGKGVETLYDRCNSCEEMFTEYLQQKMKWQGLTPMNYFFWIEQFYKLFPKEQIKVVIFEELIREPRSVMNSILEFLGIKGDYSSDTISHTNKGDYGIVNKEGYVLAGERRRLQTKLCTVDEKDVEKRSLLEKKLSEVQAGYDRIPKVFDMQMTDSQRKMAKEFFDEDVKKLGKLIGRDLTKIWE